MLTYLTKVYPEDSLRYRIYYALRHGKFLGKSYIDRLENKIKEKAFAKDSSIFVYFPSGETEVPELYLANGFPTIVPAGSIDEERDARIKSGNPIFYTETGVWPSVDNRDRYIAYPFKDNDKVRYFIYMWDEDRWFDVSDKFVSGKYVFIHYVVKDKQAERLYNIVNWCSRMHSKVTHFIYQALHTIDSCYLCIRFPFLYTRNRFTNTHYTNWKLHELEKKLYNESCASINYKVYHDESKLHRVYPARDGMPRIEHRDYKSQIKKDYNQIDYFIDCNGEEVILYSPESGYSPVVRFVTDVDENLGEIYKDAVYSPKFGWIFPDEHQPNPDLKPWSHDHSDADEPYTSYYIYLIMSPEKRMLMKLIEWFHSKVLETIFCIPTSNEIDAMDSGWFRRFGMDMLKEMKTQLKKDGQLYSYRISQIKEKWGGFVLYDGGASKELHAIIDKYSAMSEKICIDCGRDADYITSGYILPLCEHCISEQGKQGAKKLKHV